ncbi:helix-turn-helix domain-containing protein [Rhizobiaceae bacterium n13]|uniref:helix-turn-helix domain-containing protein n=1 Tax=Ferirhizobium litorale TaxID=2927786 RepID=UPI0024B2F696|nr:helix-turn-helix domain-containing protein [Fererhizobium litorale]MDI7864076.1 helix-turn-helix domain-containing protein [Fererhizobium litorale]
MEQVKVALTIPEFCNLYNVGRSFTYEEINAGRLKIRKAGKKTLILRTDADAWLQALPEKGVAA